MKKRPLWVYVIGVIIVMIIVNVIVWHLGKMVELKYVETFSFGFLVGMLAMYIAVHLYKWK